jgi:type IV secretory pathway VirB2 component (pilin)
MILLNLFLAKLTPDCAGATCTWCNFVQFGQGIINFLMQNIAFPLAVLFIIYGGIMMMINSGNPSKLQESRGIIWAAVIGLAILLGSWVILNTFFNLMTGGINWPWHTIQC